MTNTDAPTYAEAHADNVSDLAALRAGGEHAPWLTRGEAIAAVEAQVDAFARLIALADIDAKLWRLARDGGEAARAALLASVYDTGAADTDQDAHDNAAENAAAALIASGFATEATVDAVIAEANFRAECAAQRGRA